MKFSVATALYNGIPLLKRCIGSVRQQTQDVEHVVQDGLSTDGSVDWLAAHASPLATERYALAWTSEKDGGMYEAINRAWSRTTGDIMSWLNHDEQYLPGALDKVRAVFERDPTIDVVWGDFICVDDAGEAFAYRREAPARRLYMRYSPVCCIATCTLFYRRRIFDNGDLVLDASYRLNADHKLLIELLDKKYRFHRIPEFLSLFTASDDNLSARYKETAQEEYRRICREFEIGGGLKRKAINALRYLEKVRAGAYGSRSLRYRYALDETPESVEKHAEGVGHRFSF